jgi:hypothetical protein
MRLTAAMLCLALAAGCTPPRAPAPPAVDAEAPVPPPPTGGYVGPVEPLAAPLDLAYGDADFRTRVTISVAGPREGADRASTLAAHLSGRIERAGSRVLGRLVTERIEIDGRPTESREALLDQSLVLSHKGHLVELATRAPAQADPDEPLPERYRALEQRWRERLPTFSPAPVAAGDTVYADADLLAPLRQMLQDRPYEMEIVRPLRAVAVGLVPCGARRCLLARIEGEAALLAPRGALQVTTDGYELIDLASGLIVEGRGVFELTRDGDGQMLTMTVDTETTL